MNLEALRLNIDHSKEIIREIYIYTNQLQNIEKLESSSESIIDSREKRLLTEAISALTTQLRILNDSVAELIEGVGFYQRLPNSRSAQQNEKLIEVKYTALEKDQQVSLVISDRDKKEFIDNLGRSNLSINQLKKNYSSEKEVTSFAKPNLYAKMSNRFFRNLSNYFVNNGYADGLNRELRRMNSQFVVGTYLSMIFFTVFVTFA